MRRLLNVLTTLLPLMGGTHVLFAAEVMPPDIGTRRELFVDRLLIGELKNTALKLHTPQLVPPVSPPRPHGHYATVLRAADKFQFGGLAYQPKPDHLAVRERRGPGGLKAFVSPDGIH
jgi:hypothetical protein